MACTKKNDITLDFEIIQPSKDESEDVDNIEKPLFSQEEIDLWRSKLKTQIETARLHLNPELRLTELAQHFNINVSSLSTLINLCFDKNFNDLINAYRIDNFLKKINEGHLKQFTLMSIAYDSGFNSKTTFNRAFKKHTGISPTDFLKKREENP